MSDVLTPEEVRDAVAPWALDERESADRLRELEESHEALRAERDALRQALRDCAILPPSGGGDASDWFQCGLCSAVWRTRESHRSDCLLALAQTPETGAPKEEA